VGLLHSIHSAPELSSVTFSFASRFFTAFAVPPPEYWIVADEWLARIVTARTTPKVGLEVVLAEWPEGNEEWEGYFPAFRRSGGELKRNAHDYEYQHLMTVLEHHVWRNTSIRMNISRLLNVFDRNQH